VRLVKGEEDTDSAVHEIFTESFGGRLRMSRSFGDFYLKQNTSLPADQQAVIAVPEIKVHARLST
jgi:hypothetical protein